MKRILGGRRAVKRSLLWLVLAVASCGGLTLRMTHMPLVSHDGPLPDPTSDEAETAGRLRQSVRDLTEEIGERNLIAWKGLRLAEAYLSLRMTDLGFEVIRHPFEVNGREVANLEILLEGTGPERETIVVGAHYDAVSGIKGADDNASGVAAVVELAGLFAEHAPRRNLRFVFFVNEEPPFFQTESMGSLVYARALAATDEPVIAMLSIETIGYFDASPGSQHYPRPFDLLYPDRGDFVGFVGNLASRSLVHRVIEVFRSEAAFPSEGIAALERTPGIGWSDHWAFWQVGFPGVMVTDTAPFRNPHYHRQSDTWETLDFERMARVVRGLEQVLLALDAEGV